MHGNVAIKYNFDTNLWLGYFLLFSWPPGWKQNVKCPSNTLGEGGGLHGRAWSTFQVFQVDVLWKTATWNGRVYWDYIFIFDQTDLNGNYYMVYIIKFVFYHSSSSWVICFRVWWFAYFTGTDGENKKREPGVNEASILWSQLTWQREQTRQALKRWRPSDMQKMS